MLALEKDYYDFYKAMSKEELEIAVKHIMKEKEILNKNGLFDSHEFETCEIKLEIIFGLED